MSKTLAVVAIFLWVILIVPSCSGMKLKDTTSVVEHDYSADCKQ